VNIAQALREASAALAPTSDTARLDAEVLMAHALGVTRSELLLRYMDAQAPEGFGALLARRKAHEPVAYITGTQEFYGLEFAVTPAVLIPRGDSEVLVEAALCARPDARSVLDCGTGSGALLLAVLAKLGDAEGVGIDNSREALRIAAGNAKALGIIRARFQLADWTEPGWAEGLGSFDLILANPPYVETDAPLDRSVRDYEPASALFAGPAGIDAYRILLPQLPALLRAGGAVFMEIGASHAGPVRELAEASGFSVRLHVDLANRPRLVELTPSW
jgi:release factor glutamine methyltransferase